MLIDLRKIREIQRLQAKALADGDLELLDELNARRLATQARVVPHEAPPLSGADLAEAQALIQAIARDQDELGERAAAVCEALGGELRELSRGRAALAGYRPGAGGQSMLIDKSH